MITLVFVIFEMNLNPSSSWWILSAWYVDIVGQYNSIYYVVYGAYCSGIDAATASIPLATMDNMMIAVYFKGATEA